LLLNRSLKVQRVVVGSVETPFGASLSPSRHSTKVLHAAPHISQRALEINQTHCTCTRATQIGFKDYFYLSGRLTTSFSIYKMKHYLFCIGTTIAFEVCGEALAKLIIH
jgi:hypothetical protein